ncbi:coenzyme F420:L-glutamate ligase [Ruminiclostridium hungatei]|uniref:Coenzyme F420:L-glutamate ligase n=1 Tax=Ruminiclostridium hungatei TaxID=48256 RepID=A0A1V4SFX2_RUMHU|nr:nitroreductase family protein [Ruminiclostridium hungatei]OPX42375.1 coenzyme F420:L-glutamate ligase [Ruminiclostridium hungatei]
MVNDFLELAVKRRSIRKFTDTPVPREMVEYFISCAANAPSGCDSQCWHFIAVDSRELIDKLADAAAEAARLFYSEGYSGATPEFLHSREKAVSFFRNAPLVIFVFLDGTRFYDKKAVDAFYEKGYDYRGMVDRLGYYDVLSVGAAIQNLLLAVSEKGYGACWMNDPVIADGVLKELLGAKESLQLLSVIPIGQPKYIPREKVLKDKKSILEFR